MGTDTNDGQGYWIYVIESIGNGVWLDLTKVAMIRASTQPEPDTYIVYFGDIQNGITVDSLTNGGAHSRVREWLDSRRI